MSILLRPEKFTNRETEQSKWVERQREKEIEKEREIRREK